MVYLVNYVCYLPNRIEQQLRSFGIEYLSVTEKEWCSQLQCTILFRQPYSNIWLHIWDDHPFMCGKYFQYALRKKIVTGENNIFVVYNDSYRLNLWHQQLDKDIREKFSYMYSSNGKIDYYKLNSHVFIVNSETGENFDALIFAIRKMVGS